MPSATTASLYVDEENCSWCTSSSANDHCAITIEVASNQAKKPYSISGAAYKSLIHLLVGVCKSNEIPELRWQGDKNLIGQVEKQKMTVHQGASKSCEEALTWSQETLEKLIEKDSMVGNGQNLDLSQDMLRILVILDRAGVFGAKKSCL